MPLIKKANLAAGITLTNPSPGLIFLLPGANKLQKLPLPWPAVKTKHAIQ